MNNEALEVFCAFVALFIPLVAFAIIGLILFCTEKIGEYKRTIKLKNQNFKYKNVIEASKEK